MDDIYVIEALRTPFGSLGGMLAGQEAPRLGAAVIRALMERTGLPADAVDEVIIGQVLTGGSGQAPARQALRLAGLSDATHALTVNKVCGSGLKALMLAGDSIRLGESRVAIAGGQESMTMAPYALKKGRSGYRLGHGTLLDLMVYDGLQDPDSGRHMGEIAEGSAGRAGLGRGEQDAYARRSYELARAAVRDGVLRDEIVPYPLTDRAGTRLLAEDEEPFRTDPARLGDLPPAFTPDGTITAGNASTINDGAALALLASGAGLRRYGLTPRARVVAGATVSLHPDRFPEATAAAVTAVCARAGLSPAAIDLFEINEAFAAVALLTIRTLGLPEEKVNVNGGACALGHPIGASGARLVATVIRELHRRQLRYGLAALCIGGGEGVAMIVERV